MPADADAPTTEPSGLDAAADELYARPPEEFVARRTELVKAARSDGDKALAQAVGALRRPTRSGWLVNLLARAGADEVGTLLGLADRWATAQADGDGAALRRLTVERRGLVDRLAARAVALGAEHGWTAPDGAHQVVAQTLQAALGDAEVADAVRRGRLVGAAAGAGFGGGGSDGAGTRGSGTGGTGTGGSDPGGAAEGTGCGDGLAALLAASMPASGGRSAGPEAAAGPPKGEPSEAPPKETAAQRRRREATERVQREAEEAARAAREAARQAARAEAEAAGARLEQHRSEVAGLRKQLAEAEDALAEAEQAAERAADRLAELTDD